MGRFTQRVAIITGAGSGIGRATAERIASEGGCVVIADLNKEHGEAAAAAIRAQQGQALFVPCDVSSPEQLQNTTEQALQKFGRLDIVVNNAALMTFAPIGQIPVETWDRVLAVNLRSVFLLSKFALPHLRGGAIVNISSVHAHETTANNAPYAASKGGIEALTRALSLEIDPKIARVNAVAPGSVDTPMLRNNPNIKSGREKLLGRIAQPHEIAAAICFLASDDASFIHGTTLIADSGRLDIL